MSLCVSLYAKIISSKKENVIYLRSNVVFLIVTRNLRSCRDTNHTAPAEIAVWAKIASYYIPFLRQLGFKDLHSGTDEANSFRGETHALEKDVYATVISNARFFLYCDRFGIFMSLLEY